VNRKRGVEDQALLEVFAFDGARCDRIVASFLLAMGR